MTTESGGAETEIEQSEPFPEPDGPTPKKTPWEPIRGTGLRFPFLEDLRG